MRKRTKYLKNIIRPKNVTISCWIKTVGSDNFEFYSKQISICDINGFTAMACKDHTVISNKLLKV